MAVYLQVCGGGLVVADSMVAGVTSLSRGQMPDTTVRKLTTSGRGQTRIRP